MDIPLIDKVLKLLLVRYEVGEPVKKDPEQILIDIPYGEQDHELDVVLAPAQRLVQDRDRYGRFQDSSFKSVRQREPGVKRGGCGPFAFEHLRVIVFAHIPFSVRVLHIVSMTSCSFSACRCG